MNHPPPPPRPAAPPRPPPPRPRPAPPTQQQQNKKKADPGGTAVVMAMVSLMGAAGSYYMLPEDIQELLKLLVWDTNRPAAITAAVGGVGLLALLLVGGGKKVRWLTQEHEEAEFERKERWTKLPVAVKQRIMGPPLIAWAALSLPHGVAWGLGWTTFHFPDWIGTEVPVEKWVEGLIEVLAGPIGTWWNLLLPAVGWAVMVAAAWRPFARGWERRVLDGKGVVSKLLPVPGDYQRQRRTFQLSRKETPWKAYPTFLLGAREYPSSRKLEPYCELPSWVTFDGKAIFGGMLIFGQKGSGKTSLLKRVIEDTLRFRANQVTHKPAMMALDPKGDLSGFIQKLAAEVGRSEDVVRLAVDGPVKWNPFGHLNASTPSREIRQAGYFLRCAMPSGGGDSSYWEDNATNLLSYSMQLLAYAGQTVSFASLAKLVTQMKSSTQKAPGEEQEEGEEHKTDAQIRQDLYERAMTELLERDPTGTKGLLEELETVKGYFEGEFVHLDAKPRSIVVNTATNFLRKFEGAAYRRTFCCDPSDPSQFHGFDELVDQGQIFVLDIRAVEDGQITSALCCLAKLFCQASILTRDRRAARDDDGEPIMDRVVINVMDEYQQYVTVGAQGTQGDPEYLETSRSFKAIDVAATQQLSGLQDAVGGRDSAQRVIGSFNSLVLFRHNDAALTKYAGSLVGRRSVLERSFNVSEGGQDAERHSLLSSAFQAEKQSVTRTVSERKVDKDVLGDDLFADLETFEAVGIFSDDTGRNVVRFCSKPQWLPVRTPQRDALRALQGKAPESTVVDKGKAALSVLRHTTSKRWD